MADSKRKPPRAGLGRPKGIKNKITRELKEMILNALDKSGGEDYLVQQAQENPNAFMALVGKIIPMTVDLTVAEQLDNMTDEALDNEIKRLAGKTAIIAHAASEAESVRH